MLFYKRWKKKKKNASNRASAVLNGIGSIMKFISVQWSVDSRGCISKLLGYKWTHDLVWISFKFCHDIGHNVVLMVSLQNHMQQQKGQKNTTINL